MNKSFLRKSSISPLLLFSLPAVFSDSNFSKKIAEINTRLSGTLNVFETYGSMNPCDFGSGRAVSILPKVSAEDIRRYVDKTGKIGVGFNYLINSPCFGNNELSSEFSDKLFHFCEWLVSIGVKHVTCSVPTLLPIISNCKNISIGISCISGLWTPCGIEYAKQFQNVERICVPEKLNRNINMLKTCISFAAPIKVVTVVNNMCLLSCPFREYHYNFYGHSKEGQNDPCILACAKLRAHYPWKLLSSPWVRPEDIDQYVSAGVSFFKVAGRGLEAPDFFPMLLAYSKRQFTGNLVKLFRAFSHNDYWDQFELNSKEVNNVMKTILHQPIGCDEYQCFQCGICESFEKRCRIFMNK